LAIWGKEYIYDFMEQILPLHFSPGNLLAFSENNCSVEFVFYTLLDDVERFSHYSSYRKLKNLMPVSVKGVKTRHTDKFYIMTELHNLAVLDAENKDSTMIFFFADVVFSEGYFSRLIELRNEGYRAVLGFALLTNKDEFIQSYHLSSGRKFVQQALSCVHDEVRTHDWDDSLVSEAPNSITFPLHENRGLLIRSFHWTPIMLAPIEKGIQSYWTIDVDLVRRTCLDYRCIYIVTDSDDMAIASLSKKDDYRQKQILTKGATLEVFAQWSLLGADPFHLKFFQEKLWFLFEQKNPSLTATEEISDKVVKDIFLLRKSISNVFEDIVTLSQGRDIIIFGAGGYGQLVSRTLIHYDCHTAAFFDNDPNKWGMKYGPVQVKKPDFSNSNNCFFIITAERYNEIVVGLKKYGLVENNDFFIFKSKHINKFKG